jgi:N-acyl-D-amino-acid deacylase
VQAELARIDGDNVVLRKSDGTTVEVPIAQLSPADRAFAASLRKTMNPAEEGGAGSAEAASFSRLKSGRPVTGEKSPGVEILDETMDQFMDLIHCQAGTVAVAYGGKLLYSRGYGWIDEANQRPAVPQTTMRIASCAKPVTAAAIKSLIRARCLDPNAFVFPNLEIEPPGGSVADPRLNQITVLHLLEHKGGFDCGQAFDPMFAINRIERELDLTSQPTPVDVIRFMLGQPLQFDPGQRSSYSNYGYCVLGRVIEKASGKSYIDYVQQTIAHPLRIQDLALSRNRPEDRPPSEVNYRTDGSPFTVEVMDAHGGLSTSTPSLCKFMQAYWISGEPRRRGDQQNWLFFGSLPGTTAMMQQRQDGILCAVLLNNRRDDQFDADNDRLREIVNQAIDRLKAGAR